MHDPNFKYEDVVVHTSILAASTNLWRACVSDFDIELKSTPNFTGTSFLRRCSRSCVGKNFAIVDFADLANEKFRLNKVVSHVLDSFEIPSKETMENYVMTSTPNFIFLMNSILYEDLLRYILQLVPRYNKSWVNVKCTCKLFHKIASEHYDKFISSADINSAFANRSNGSILYFAKLGKIEPLSFTIPRLSANRTWSPYVEKPVTLFQWAVIKEYWKLIEVMLDKESVRSSSGIYHNS